MLLGINRRPEQAQRLTRYTIPAPRVDRSLALLLRYGLARPRPAPEPRQILLTSQLGRPIQYAGSTQHDGHLMPGVGQAMAKSMRGPIRIGAAWSRIPMA